MYNTINFLQEVNTLLSAFKVERHSRIKNDPTFPWGNTQEHMHQSFTDLCKSRENYLEWLDHYTRLVHYAERQNKHVKKAAYDYLIPQAEAQSELALLANAVTKLIWLRRAGKQWCKDTVKLRVAA